MTSVAKGCQSSYLNDQIAIDHVMIMLFHWLCYIYSGAPSIILSILSVNIDDVQFCYRKYDGTKLNISAIKLRIIIFYYNNFNLQFFSVLFFRINGFSQAIPRFLHINAKFKTCYQFGLMRNVLFITPPGSYQEISILSRDKSVVA